MFCRNCGTNLSDGARFCSKCGQKVEYVAQGAGMNTSSNIGINTSSNMYNDRPVNSGNYNQNKPKKKHTALIAIAIVLGGIFLLIGIVFISAVFLSKGDDKDAGQSEAEDPYYDDVIRCIQGDWYVWEKDGTRRAFCIDGTRVTEYMHFDILGEDSQVNGDIETTDRKGELKIVDNNCIVENLYYTYDENTDSIELTCNGNILKRNDVYGRIGELIQGDWNDFNSIEEGGLKHYFTFVDNEFILEFSSGYSDSGKVEINPDGKLILSTSYADVLTIYYEYDENTDSIVLTFEGNVLEKE